jgi:hypothetical protein
MDRSIWIININLVLLTRKTGIMISVPTPLMVAQYSQWFGVACNILGIDCSIIILIWTIHLTKTQLHTREKRDGLHKGGQTTLLAAKMVQPPPPNHWHGGTTPCG